MRTAISTDGDRVAPHFGRCEAYTIVDIEEAEVVSREHIANPGHEPGFLPGLAPRCSLASSESKQSSASPAPLRRRSKLSVKAPWPAVRRRATTLIPDNITLAPRGRAQLDSKGGECNATR